MVESLEKLIYKEKKDSMLTNMEYYATLILDTMVSK